ncbi:hypothetical protein HZ992_16840 [Rhizobacter sp. AJA081-3]|uniref:tripartite tricarboxylate transporter substrate-binding protein n=1 Tax=Rhizobacter sp. AJA081-3 TaxID=2753607 RepID=UPI001ADFBF00|nr:tripartite tricarboxylate transporter substrate-binding protein [Rhizobacter sp. AJA081-3]QTN21829.1 hypothetical protein HZ992_16840 [Rhizobacter sp. AJA081-3]
MAAAKAAPPRGALRIVTGFPAGGGADVVARLLGEQLRTLLGIGVVVENMPGAGSRVALEHVRTAAADGSIVLLAPDATMFLYPHIFKSLRYEPVSDFKPIARLVSLPLAMFIGPMVPAGVATVADYIDWARANASRWIYGTSAPGATPHFAGMMFGRAAGLSLTPIHYQGGAPGIQDLAGGHLPAFFGSVADGLGLLAAGRIRVLATTAPRRVAVLPNTPSFNELGYRELIVEDGLGVHAPSGLPVDVGARLSAALLKSMQAPALKTALLNRGFEAAPEGPSDFADRLQRERARWGQIVQATGFVAVE